ncbi:MAG TPA: M20/M25/M40 family metallo-hydrolase [Thermoanaerobaculia bacterium]|nr:M20/M25/M40 family metallo-hydrolase [Thermoanaerobaculia bacterium]
MLDQAERELVRAVESRLDEEIAFLREVVDLDSGTLNLAGVREVGGRFARELGLLGFSTRWADLPSSMGRAGHLVAERPAPERRGMRVLLLGHLDTVFEGAGHRFARTGEQARGAGITDMKGGDVAIVFALQALHSAGALERAAVRVILTGDEENPALPGEVSRGELIRAAAESDVVLSFETDSGRIAIGRRGLTKWSLEVSGAQGHSASILRPALGAGAVYETARALDGFRQAFSGHPTVTVNPGIALGGTRVEYDPAAGSGSAAGKFNIVAPRACVRGDLRFVSDTEREEAKERMRAIAAASLPRTGSRLEFENLAPGWPATEGNRRLLAVVDAVSRDLGQGPAAADDPASRGFGDMNFIGAAIPGIDGLGVSGVGEHSPSETMDLGSLAPSTARAAVLIGRLLRMEELPGL